MTLRAMRGMVAAFAVLALSACAAPQASSGSDVNANRLTAEEILASGASTAYDAIERLRPRWLRVRMERSHNQATEIVVFVDNMQMSGMDALRDVDARLVRSIRWLDSAQAGQMPGMGSRHVEGAIVVETR